MTFLTKSKFDADLVKNKSGFARENVKYALFKHSRASKPPGEMYNTLLWNSSESLSLSWHSASLNKQLLLAYSF